MKYMIWPCLFLFLIMSCSHKTPELKAQKSQCDNFLKDLNIVNDKLILNECVEGKGFGTNLPAITARYTIAGSEAKALEQQLISKFKMTPLKFACCGWEARPKDVAKNNLYYTIWMSSEETLVKDWSKINKFNLKVEQMWELP